MSWYPSSFRSTVCVPADSPGMVAGLTPRWIPSMKMKAPAGVVVMEREPSVSGWAGAMPAACMVPCCVLLLGHLRAAALNTGDGCCLLADRQVVVPVTGVVVA